MGSGAPMLGSSFLPPFTYLQRFLALTSLCPVFLFYKMELIMQFNSLGHRESEMS